MSIEDKVDKVFDFCQTRSDAIDTLQYSIEVLGATLREAGVITDEQIRAAHKRVREDEKARENAASMKERLTSTLGPQWGSFIGRF